MGLIVEQAAELWDLLPSNSYVFLGLEFREIINYLILVFLIFYFIYNIPKILKFIGICIGLVFWYYVLTWAFRAMSIQVAIVLGAIIIALVIFYTKRE